MAKSEYYVDPSGGNDTTGDGTIGTPWKTVQKALDSITRNTTDGDRINVKDTADDVLSAELDFSTYGANSLNYALLIQGYTSTAGDGGIGGISGGGTTAIISTQRSYIAFKDMHLHNTGSNVILNIYRSSLDNCEFNNSSSTGNIVEVSQAAVINCYFHDTDGSAVAGGSCVIFGCYFKAGATYEMDTCINATAASLVASRCILSIDGATNGIGGVAILAQILNNSILSDGGTGTGIDSESGGWGASYINNVVEGFSGTGGVGITNTPSRDVYSWSNNSVYNCATDSSNEDEAYILYGNESLGSSPFAKSGSDTRANRFTYFEPVDVGSVYGGGTVGLDRGAVPQPAGGGGGGLLRVNMNGNVFG